MPPEHRLALAYAPSAVREQTAALFALDARLGHTVRHVREPLLGQLKLAWWRDRLDEAPERWPSGEPLLAALRCWQDQTGDLAPLVDGWEAMLGGEVAGIEALSDARAEAWVALARLAGCPQAGPEARRAARNWSLAELALGCDNAEQRERVVALAGQQNWRRPNLPRALRPLAILHGLAMRAVQRNASGLLVAPTDLAAAIRIGLFGR